MPIRNHATKRINWNVLWKRARSIPIDMAGFAINLKLILDSKASFSERCIQRPPEPCLLEQIAFSPDNYEVYTNQTSPKEIYVWHTKTMKSKAQGNTHGYEVEFF